MNFSGSLYCEINIIIPINMTFSIQNMYQNVQSRQRRYISTIYCLILFNIKTLHSFVIIRIENKMLQFPNCRLSISKIYFLSLQSHKHQS